MDDSRSSASIGDPCPKIMCHRDTKGGEEEAHAPSRPEVQQSPKILRRRASCWAVLIVGLAVRDGMMQGQP
jgi:hypothetical protein